MTAPTTRNAPARDKNLGGDIPMRDKVLDGDACGHCFCTACRDGVIHASDCAVHNMPALPNGACDCGVIERNREQSE